MPDPTVITDPPASLVPDRPAEPLDLIARAIEKGFDTEQLGKLMDLQERHQRQLAERAYAESMSAAQAAMPTVVRDAENTHTKARYARLETVNHAIKPVFTRYGFSISFDTEQSPLAEHIRIRADVSHAGGCTKSYRADIPLDGAGFKGNSNKTPTQATGSTFSYGRRYLTLLIFNVTVANEDNDGNREAEVVTPEQIAVINDLLKECEEVGNPVNFGRFLHWLGVQQLDELPAGEFAKAVNELNAKRRVKKAAAPNGAKS